MLLKEMVYPSSWSMQDFMGLRNKTARLEYAKKHLTPIGKGSSRNVYRIDEDKVLKIANKKGDINKGTAQNEQEVDMSLDHYVNHLFAPVFDYDKEKFLWIEMAYAKPITKSKFKKLIGFDFDFFMENLYYEYNRIKRNGKNTPHDSFYENDFFLTI